MKNALLLIPLLASAACAGARAVPARSAPPVDPAAARAALVAADRAHARATAAGLVDGFASFLADSAAFLPSGPDVLYGDAAIRAHLASDSLFGGLTWENVRAEVSADGSAGWTLGFGTMTARSGATRHARILSYWRRQADGAWKVVATLPSASRQEPRPVPASFGTPSDVAARPGDPAAALAAVMQADRDFAALSAARTPAAAFHAYADPTGVLLGGPSYGPDEIRQALEGDFTLDWVPLAGGVAASGDLGYTIGHGVSRSTAGTGYSKYLTIWKRQPDGRWLFVADGGTARPAS